MTGPAGRSRAHPERVPQLAADTPPAIVANIERAMAKRPAERYASARELAAALQDVIAEGLRGRESRTIRVFADTVGVLVRRSVQRSGTGRS